MSDTTINYKGKSFWISEIFIELLSYYLCETLDKKEIEKLTKGVQGIYRNCDANRSGINAGMVSIPFDHYIVSEEEKLEILTILDETKNAVIELDDSIPLDELNRIENLKEDDYFKRPWTIPIQKQSLIATIGLIEKMLKGEWDEPDNYGVWFKGYPHPKGVKTI